MRARQAFLYALCLGFSVFRFFQAQWLSGFAVLFGDRLDGGIQVALLEHWRNVLAGREHWAQPLYYFPYRDTLGFNDGYVLYGLPYAGFRALGADPFLGGELVDVALRVVAFGGMELFLRRSIRVDWPLALWGAVVFTTSCGAMMQAGHSQTLSVGFAPVFATLLWSAAETFSQGRHGRAAGWGVAAVALMGAWLLTAFYMAWFTLFVLAIFLCLAAAAQPRRCLRYLGGVPRQGWFALAAVGAAGLAAAVPFLIVYLPAAAATGMHRFEQSRYYATSVLDLVHVGDGNPMWSWLDRALQARFRPHWPRYDEHTVGLTPVLLVLFVVALVRLWRERARPGVQPVLLLAAATVIGWAFTVRIGGAAFWFGVFELVPGAAALRVIVRYQLFMVGPVIAVAAWYLAQRRALWLGGAVALLIVAGQVTFGAQLGLDRAAEMARLDAVPPPPPTCQSFFVQRARPEHTGDATLDGIYSPNVDAMLIAERFGLPTAGGFSTFTPPDWVFRDPGRPDYLADVAKYAAAHGLAGLCGLDLVTMRWDPAPFG